MNGCEDSRKIAEQLDICKMEEPQLPVVRRLWKECFGDDEEYVDFYFREYGEGRTTWILRNACVKGMVTEMTCGLVRGDSVYPIRYQYAGGVFKEFRGHGLFQILMRARREDAKAQGEAVIFEPGPGLFEYYRRMGYRDVFSVKEYSYDVNAGESAVVQRKALRCASPDVYQKVRDQFFYGDGYVVWGLSHIRYAILECQLAGGGAFYTGDTAKALPHLALVGGIRDGVLEVKEAMIPDECLEKELSELAAAFCCDKVMVRLPVWSKMPGCIKEFGVGYGSHIEGMERPYMNLTLD